MSLRRQIIAVREELKNVSLPGALNLIQTYISMKTHPIHVHSLPTMVQIEPTLRCNLRCRMCVRTYWRKRSGDLGFENYQRIVDQFPHLRQLNLTGVGESLLNRDFFRMVEYAKSRKIYVKLFDSGTMLDQRAAENMVSSGLDELFISLDGATPETYERIRVGAHLDHVIENTKNLLRTKEKAGSSTPEVLIIMTAMRENFTEIPRMVELAHSIGVKSVAVQGLQVFGEGMARRDQLVSEMKPRDVLRIIHQSKRLGKSLGVNIEFARMVPKPQQCFWPWVACFITYDGQVAPCCMINQRIDREEVLESLGFGNVLKEPFKEIWNSEKAMLFRLKLATGDLPLICRGCPVLDGTVISF